MFIYLALFCSTTHNSQDMEISLMLVNRCIYNRCRYSRYVYIYMYIIECYPAMKKEDILPFVVC